MPSFTGAPPLVKAAVSETKFRRIVVGDDYNLIKITLDPAIPTETNQPSRRHATCSYL